MQAEVRWRAADSSIHRQPFEIFGRVSKREAAVAGAMFVRALETLARVAEQQRARGHQFPARSRMVLKAAGGDDGDGDVGVQLFEGTILLATGAYDVRDRPSYALREPPRGGIARHSVALPARHFPFDFNRNFCQVFPLAAAL